jgi:drug/metabolite transporter (DMT)-like permease
VSEGNDINGPHHTAPASGSLRYFLALILVNLMWAFQFSGAKIATESLGPITVTLLPLAISTVLFSPFALFGRARTNRRAARRSTPKFVLAGTAGVLAAQLGVTWGVKLSQASNAAVLSLTTPVLTAMMAVVMLGERMTLVRWLSFLFAILGVLMVSDLDWRSVDLFRGTYLVGNVLICVSCLGSAFYNTYSKRLLEVFSPLELLVYTFLVADAVLLVLALQFEQSSLAALTLLDLEVWLSLAAIAVFSLSISMMLFFWVLQSVAVTQASLSIYLLPVFGVLLSAVTVGESVTWQLAAGGILVLASTFLVTAYEEGQKTKAAASGCDAAHGARTKTLTL